MMFVLKNPDTCPHNNQRRCGYLHYALIMLIGPTNLTPNICQATPSAAMDWLQCLCLPFFVLSAQHRGARKTLKSSFQRLEYSTPQSPRIIPLLHLSHL